METSSRARRQRYAFLPWCVALFLAGLAITLAPTSRAQAPIECDTVSLESGTPLIDAYAQDSPHRAKQTNTTGGVPARVSVEIPPIEFTGPGTSATLPVGPCQHIYRYDFGKVRAPGGERPSPFRYAEVDWNTEGIPRGPNNSFGSAHFDFHFYLRSRDWVNRETRCTSSDGRVCDPLLTSYPQMQCFLRFPQRRFVPKSYAPDAGSPISKMGSHMLDRNFDYTTENVNHYPTLIYGSFDGRVLFAETSVTLHTLQDVLEAPGQEITYPYDQPRAVRGGVPWPSRFTLRYLPDTGGFQAAFERFRTPKP